MIRKIIRGLNGLVSVVTAVALLVCGAYAGYALWDNQQVYASAENVQADMLRLKPKVEETDGEAVEAGPSFAELLAINPDVCAWVSMDNTRIDYPVLQGETNLSYINTDVYGHFALPGSIFLDSRCDRTYHEPYALLYGHHMAQGAMFGDLDLYKDKQFFLENRTGTLMLPDRVYDLETFACLLVTASDDHIFEPDRWEESVLELLPYVQEHAMYVHGEVMAELTASWQDENVPDLPILALTTCSSEFTDARTIVLTVMRQR